MDKVQDNAILRILLKFFEGKAYPIVIMLLAVFSCSVGMQAYIPVLYIFALSTLFVAIFSKKSRVMLTPVFFSYFAIGADKLATNDDALNHGLFNSIGFINIIISISIIILSIFIRLIIDGSFRKIFTKRSDQTFGIIALIVAFICNGLFSFDYSIWDLLIGVLISISFIFVYLLFLNDLDYEGCSSQNDYNLLYISSLSLLAGIAIVLEVLILGIKLGINGSLFVDSGLEYRVFNAERFVLGWGVQNLIGFFLMLFIPLILYNVYKNRYVLISLFTVVLMIITMFVICSKVVFYISIVEVIAALIAILVKGENKSILFNLLIVLLACLTVGIIVFIVLGIEHAVGHFLTILHQYSFDFSKLSSWQLGLQDFLKAPLFGVGFAKGTGENINIFSNMYHNVFIEFLGGTGIVGVIGFIWHLKKIVELSIRAFNVDRLFIISSLLSVLIASFFDNYFFYPCVLIYYGVLLAATVLNQEQARRQLIAEYKPIEREKPRVLFTYIEAGQGHIVPEIAICEAFKRKYGDKTQVIESYIFRDSDNKDMRKFGNNLAINVKAMDKYPFYGFLLAASNVVFDDYISLNYCHRGRFLKYNVYKPALKELESLDADLLFTTHWSSAYFAMKLKPHPYCVMYCPDAYSNGMFNLDVNELFLTTKVGYDKVIGRRMYAGGNLTKVPFAINEKAYTIKGTKNAIRESLGIKQDAFVVILADGLYGVSKLSRTIDELIKTKENLTIIAVFGKNENGYKKYSNIDVPENIQLLVYGYASNMLELIEASDVFIGKSGANLMSEPTFFEKPIVVSCCATKIEQNLKNYYVNDVGNAVYIPNVKKITKFILNLKNNEEIKNYYIEKAKMANGNYGAEEIADLLYQRLEKIKNV